MTYDPFDPFNEVPMYQDFYLKFADQAEAARYAVNGTLGGSDYALASIPTLDQVVLGSGKGFLSNSTLNGWLRRVTYYPSRLSNAQLQTITT